MKGKLILLLAFISLVAAEELPASISGTPSFSGCNCRLEGTPNPVQVGVMVHNPSDRTMRLSYEWFDTTINDYREGTDLSCGLGSKTILPYGFGSCTLSLYTMMGGSNGTLKTTFKMKGDNGVDNYTKTFAVSIEYHTSPYEINVVGRAQALQSSLDELHSELEGQCSEGLCCGMVRVNQYLSFAAANISQANYSLRSCKLSDAWEYLANASGSILISNNSFMHLRDNCSSALSLISSARRRIDSVSQLASQGNGCGSEVSLSQSLLRSANDSVNEASVAVLLDNYSLAFSKLSDANNSILSAVSSIGECNQSRAEEQSSQPTPNASTLSSNEVSPEGGSIMPLVGGLLVALVLFALAAIAVLYFTRRRTGKAPPQAPPSKTAPPPSPPTLEMHDDLEKEFNEWLDSHSQKK